jgi:excisionase family DNA binding protein
MTAEPLPIEAEVFTPAEAAAYLKMSRKTFDKEVRDSVPHFRRGKIIRFKKDDLLALFDSRK